MEFLALAIAQRVGYESIDITDRYAHLFPTKQTENANRLYNAIFYIKFLMYIPIKYVYRIKLIFNNEYRWLNAKDSKLLKGCYPFLERRRR